MAEDIKKITLKAIFKSLVLDLTNLNSREDQLETLNLRILHSSHVIIVAF